MKNILYALACLLIISLPASADEITKTIKLPTLQCGMCKSKIESKVSHLKGLDSITVDVELKQATVTFDDAVTTIAKIERAIAKTGYDANDVKADRRAQRKLDACCQPDGHE